MNQPATVRLELSTDELALLTQHLRRHLEDMDRELVRTDKASLQHALAQEAKVLAGVVTRFEAAKK